MPERDVIAEIRVSPTGVGPSLSRYVAAGIRVLDETKDITYQLTAMGTIIQAPKARIFELVSKMSEAIFNMGAVRVSTQIFIDERRDKKATIESKVKAVLDANKKK